MKYTLSLILAIFCIFFLATCTDNFPTPTYRLEIQNNSSYSVELLCFSSQSRLLRNRFSILEGQIYRKDSAAADASDMISIEDILKGDSVQILFNNTKKITYTCINGPKFIGCLEPRNILVYGNYILNEDTRGKGRKGTKLLHFVYPITDEDFLKAQ